MINKENVINAMLNTHWFYLNVDIMVFLGANIKQTLILVQNVLLHLSLVNHIATSQTVKC